jgi:hypothetical protein
LPAVSLTSTPRARIVIALAIAGALAVSAISGLGGEGVLVMAPVLLLLGMLFARRYPGAALLTRLATRARRRRLRPCRARASAPRMAARAPRGGLLMGFALAVRPPPRLATAS